MSRDGKKRAAEHLQRALQMLNRASHGVCPQDSQLDGDAPVNEWFAIGSAKSSIRFALAQLGIKTDQE